MARETETKRIIVSRLTQGPARRSDLSRLTGVRPRSIASVISRLRDEQFKIVATGQGDPLYEMLGGPGSLGPSFVCPKCMETIRIGHPSDHQIGCPFGTPTLNGKHTI